MGSTLPVQCVHHTLCSKSWDSYWWRSRSAQDWLAGLYPRLVLQMFLWTHSIQLKQNSREFTCKTDVAEYQINHGMKYSHPIDSHHTRPILTTGKMVIVATKMLFFYIRYTKSNSIQRSIVLHWPDVETSGVHQVSPILWNHRLI